tara:strand:+ start:1277 stop:2524 length:1248 start_codon:yes stop_codon:yes gene_type:complete
MTNSNDMDGIEVQYTRHPYPAPISDMRERIQLGYRQGSSPDQIWNKLFPEKAYKDDLNILIAGCGTNQAIYHALMFPNSHHYAIDVSRESLRHVADMIKAYDIKNLEIEKKDIIDLTHNKEFDYVISTGVIHHTENPQESLSKLIQTSKNDGALFIMIYASYLRMGLYYLQDAFRYLDLKPDEKGIEIARKLIELSPKDHYVHKYIKAITNTSGTKDLSFDAGFVDTFFNARDNAYDIFELKELIDNAGAYFQCWDDNAWYYRSLFNFPKAGGLIQSFNALDPWQLADFTQKMSPNSGKLTFILRKEEKYAHRFFNILDVFPTTYAHSDRLTNLEPPDFASNYGGAIGYNQVRVNLDIIERVVWDNLGNKILDIQSQSNALFLKHGIDKEISFESLREMLHRYWKNGYVTFSDSP